MTVKAVETLNVRAGSDDKWTDIVDENGNIRLGDDVTDGELPMANQSRIARMHPHEYQPSNKYSEEFMRDQGILSTIVAYEESLHFKVLVDRGSNDPEVRKQHGVATCRRKRLSLIRKARADYLHSQGIHVLEDPSRIGLGSPELQDEFDRGAALWLAFRTTVLEKDGVRQSMKEDLKEKLEQDHSSL